MLPPQCWFSALVTMFLCCTGASGMRTRPSATVKLDSEATTTDCDLNRYSELKGRFDNIKYAGSGASGCVITANDKYNNGQGVAIKVSKTVGNYDKWKKECEQTKYIHKLACEAGGLQMMLSERFLPNCLSMGGIESEPYIVMHPVGQGEGLGQKSKLLKNVPPRDRASVFAQIVGAVAALHGIGYSHNDLTNENVAYVQKGIQTKIALLDFGSATPESRAHYSGTYKQDETVIPRRAGELADCPASDFPGANSHIHAETKERLIACLQDRWASEGADDEFFDAFGKVYDETVAGRQPEHILDLFKTKFVAKHFPTMDRLFPNAECEPPKPTPERSGETSQDDEWVIPREDDPPKPRIPAQCGSPGGQHSDCPHVAGQAHHHGYTLEQCAEEMERLGGDTFNYRHDHGACYVKKCESEDMQYTSKLGSFDVYSTFC